MFRDPDHSPQTPVFDNPPARTQAGDGAVARETPGGALVVAAKHAQGQIERPPRRRSRRKLLIAAAIIGLFMGLGGWYGLHYWQIGRFLVSTDDAYVRADATTLGAKV